MILRSTHESPRTVCAVLPADTAPAARVLMLHGLTDTPAAVQPWAEHLREHGYLVSAPLLPGHGTSASDLSKTGWRDWYRGADEALDEIVERARPVAVIGHSMGGALALELAAARPDEVSAVVLVNPSVAHPSPFVRLRLLGALKYLVRDLPNGGLVYKPHAPVTHYPRMPLASIESMSQMWRHLDARMSQVRQPVVLFRSVADGAAGVYSARRVLSGVSSSEIREVLLHNSGHSAMLDHDAGLIFEDSLRFLDSL